MSEARVVERGLTEQEKVLGWRLYVLKQAGYGNLAAHLLAASDSDLHKMVDVKKNGCSDEVALRIYS